MLNFYCELVVSFEKFVTKLITKKDGIIIIWVKNMHLFEYFLLKLLNKKLLKLYNFIKLNKNWKLLELFFGQNKIKQKKVLKTKIKANNFCIKEYWCLDLQSKEINIHYRVV